ncbi:transposase [Streptomyces sp. NPDC053750]|uniref:transposase n=1 Tax=Streptomyces sp. NPDC053750 TaxID=3365714 RepID=UPI0037CEA470
MRCRPDQVIADKAYSSRGFRAHLRKRGMAHTIPERTDQRRHRLRRGGHGGRSPGFDRQTCRRRNMIERCFNRLKGVRGIATRYERPRHFVRSGGRPRIIPALGKIRLNTEPRPVPAGGGGGAGARAGWNRRGGRSLHGGPQP